MLCVSFCDFLPIGEGFPRVDRTVGNAPSSIHPRSPILVEPMHMQRYSLVLEVVGEVDDQLEMMHIPMMFLYHYILTVRKSKDYVYGIWVYKALDVWKGYYRVKKNHWFRTWNREQRQEIINIWNITPNLHTNSHFEMWAEKWTIMQEASGSSTAPNAARRISC